MPLSCGTTLQQKNISPPGSTQPCSRARLQSLAITIIRCQLCIASLAAPTHAQRRGMLLFWSGALLLYPVWHMLICMKVDVPCTSNPKALCQWIMPPRFVVSTHWPCVRSDLDCSPELGWSECRPPLQLTSKGGIVDDHMRPCHCCCNSKTFVHAGTLLISTLRYVPR